MNEKLQNAIDLRSKKKFVEAEEQFLALCNNYPKEGAVFYHYAWLCDNMGREKEACPKYEKALELGLNKQDLKACYLGLGSTYRCIGKFQESVKLLDKAIDQFPQNQEFKVFRAMALTNLNQHDRAIEILLKVIAETSSDNGILIYKNAILLYAEQWTKKMK